MIINERLTTYLHSLDCGNDAFLEDLRSYAGKTGVPIIRREMESFLQVLLALCRPEHILEIGTGIGYSAIFMAEHSEAEILTLESYEKRIREARKQIAAWQESRQAPVDRGDKPAADTFGLERLKQQITLLEGDAVQLLPGLTGTYDLIFLDAAKAQYLEMLPDLLRLLKPGGVLLADNVLQEGRLIESRFVTERRQRTIHERMRSFLWEVKHHPQLTTGVITIGDGVSLSVKLQ